MRYASIDKIECRNGLGWGVTLYVQGCHFHCKNCFNPETWSFDGGKEYTEDTQQTVLKLLGLEYIKHFTVQGGEPLEQQNHFELAKLINLIKQKRPDIKIWVYTGYTYENLASKESTYLEYILNNIDVLVDGQFQEDKKDLTYPFAGSTNQRVINMRDSREQNKIVLLNI